jgi:hypothetical protein
MQTEITDLTEENTPGFVELMKRGVKHIQQAQEIFARGSLDYYLVKLVEHSEALLMRFAPIKKGERAIIIKKIKCEGGWLGSEKNLEVGVEGIVEDVDYVNGAFAYTFVPDVQMYRDREGNYKDKASKSSYRLNEKYLHRSA